MPVIPCALINTLPLRLSFPFDSTDRPRLKMDFHLFDFPENFLLKDMRDVMRLKPRFFPKNRTLNPSYLLSVMSMTVWYSVAVLVLGRLFSRWRSLCTGWLGLRERAWASSRLISFMGLHWALMGSVAYFSPHFRPGPSEGYK